VVNLRQLISTFRTTETTKETSMTVLAEGRKMPKQDIIQKSFLLLIAAGFFVLAGALAVLIMTYR
jgi:hypothetical protein